LARLQVRIKEFFSSSAGINFNTLYDSSASMEIYCCPGGSRFMESRADRHIPAIARRLQ
jgi:hypothetical protein